MSLLNRTMLYLSGVLLLILSVWALVFYVNMMDEVYDSIDDGLENDKMMIIRKAQEDRMLYQKSDFEESNYRLTPVSAGVAMKGLETYSDTAMYMLNEEDFEIVRMLTTYFQDNDGQYYQLQIVSSIVEEDDLIGDLLYALIGLFVVILISFFTINKLILSRIWKPFYQLKNELQHFKLGGNHHFKSPKTRVLEFQELSQTIAQLLKENTAIYDQQKGFIENAAHELQTPLAICSSKIELLLPQFEQNEAVLNQLIEILNQLGRMKRMNKSLLLLTKIENRQFQHQEAVDFNKLWKEQLESFRELLEHQSIRVDLEEINSQLVQHFNADLALILISNLLNNALKHNVTEGQIHIKLLPQGFSIANSGKQKELDAQSIFDRFRKDSENQQSTGLGLSIVKSIVETAKGKINYRYIDAMHVFEVHFYN